jgi:HAD superfamily hydrolase (TIGR01509 family)
MTTPAPITVEAVLFDMDGVLIDSATVIENAWRTVVAGYGRQLTEDDMRRHIHGQPGRHTAAALFPGYSARERAAICRSVDALEERATCAPLPGVVGLIKELTAARVAVGLVTSSWPERIRHVCLMLGLTGAFTTIVDRGCTPRGKPHPDPYQEAASRLRLSPDQTLAFEDSANGVASALAAGTRCVAVGTSVAEPATVATIRDFTSVRVSAGGAPPALTGLGRLVRLGAGTDRPAAGDGNEETGEHDRR